MLWSFVYLVVRNLFGLAWLLGQRRRSKEFGDPCPPPRAGDSVPAALAADAHTSWIGALLAALSRSLPRAAWVAFSFKPGDLTQTLGPGH